ncbi:MAG: hypothetical protein JNM27_16340 [Leptospirales bacterium]|nr:hypothetical protein [Leptospirales bacterium]
MPDHRNVESSQFRMLFRSEHCSVQETGSGQLIVTNGDVSLSMSKIQYMELCSTLFEALRKLHIRPH